MSGILFKYGDYEFSPRPLLNISSQPLKTPDGIGYGIMHTISLEGSVITTGNELNSGILGVFNKIEILKDALDHDGRLLLISCNDSPVISGYPTIESYNFNKESDNYTRRASYTIEFKMPTTVLGTGNDVFNSSIFPPFIETCTENWDVEFQDERMPFEWTAGSTFEKFGYVVAVTHTVDVKSRITYTGNEVSNVPWQDALDYASSKLGFDSDFVTLTGALGLPGSGSYFSTYDIFNNYRKVSTNKTEGSVQIVETFIVTPSGSGSLPNNAIETFDISTSQNDGITAVSINGEIQGLANISYNDGFSVVTSKFSSASGYYNVVKSRLYDRANTAYSAVKGGCFTRPLNPVVKTRTVGLNPINGTISYSYEFDTTANACISGECILSQSINIDDALQTDVFASQVVLGRAMGPILQDIGTTTARTRTVNIELVVMPPTGCSTIAQIYSPIPTGQIEGFISVISGDLSSNYSQVFVSSNSQNWNFTAGRYTKSIGFTYTNCSG